MSLNAQNLIEEIHSKYSEWFEMSGDKAPDLMNTILANLLIKEKQEKEFYKKVYKTKVCTFKN